MFKYFVIFIFCSFALLNGSIIDDKVKNIIGQKNYSTHQNLINLLFKNKDKFVVNEKIKYYNVFKILRENGLLNLRLETPSEITLEFKALNNNIKAFKILNDTMKSIGYRYFFTKSFEINEQKELFWTIKFKAEYIVDNVVLLNELQQKNCRILKVENRGSNTWHYEIDFQNSILKEAYKIEKNEKVKFQKPLQEYFIMVDDASVLQIVSKKLNSWFPYIVFFDENLIFLEQIKKDRIYAGYKMKIPKGTKYIKITDRYNLINIKRGLSIIVK